MIVKIRKILKPAIFSLLPAAYRIGKIVSFIYPTKDEYGVCSVCGKYSKFKYYQIIDRNSTITISCGFDEQFTEVINITNSLHCKFCNSKFRVRCAAESLLKYFMDGKYNSINSLFESLDNERDVRILETDATDGIFSGFSKPGQIIKSEYFDNVNRGEYKNGVRSEDLQDLTFENNSLDIVIALDVFEHIADPFKAFAEVTRVLKPGGIGVVTVPIDKRVEETTTFAEVLDGEIKYIRPPAYHSDKLREEGALVFTEFGMDIKEKLILKGFNIRFDSYTTERSKVTQYVIILRK